MHGYWIWATAALLYAGFRLWYDNWRGKLTPQEIEVFMRTAKENGADKLNDLEIVRQFLKADDGREFVMVNLVRIPSEPVLHPLTGKSVAPIEMMQHYSQHFVKLLVRHGGHPALVTRKIGGYVDAWQVPPDPGWSVVGFMRYRSRRDMMEMVTNPGFNDMHQFKVLGVAETFSFPSQPMIKLFVGPRLWVALVLALAAALVQIVILVHWSF